MLAIECSKPGGDEGRDREDDGQHLVGDAAPGHAPSTPPCTPARCTARREKAPRRTAARPWRWRCGSPCCATAPSFIDPCPDSHTSSASPAAPAKLAAHTSAQLRSSSRRAHMAAGPRHRDQVVAGEQLRPGHDDQDQAEREDQPAEQARGREAERRIAGHEREHQRTQADEGAGQHAEQRLRQPRQARLGHADSGHARGNLLRRVGVGAEDLGHAPSSPRKRRTTDRDQRVPVEHPASGGVDGGAVEVEQDVGGAGLDQGLSGAARATANAAGAGARRIVEAAAGQGWRVARQQLLERCSVSPSSRQVRPPP